MNAKAANKKQTTISAANNWIYPQQVESRDRRGLRNWKGMWGPLLAKGRVQPAFHTHTHTGTHRQTDILCAFVRI